MTDDKKIIIALDGQELLTPQKNPLWVPTRALADAIADEFRKAKPSSVIRHPSSAQAPLTALAYTAIDRIEGQEEAIIDALMVYGDTDTLSYALKPSPSGRGLGEGPHPDLLPEGEGILAARQQRLWKPIIDWASREFGAIWQTASGIEPATQVPEMHEAIRAYLKTQGAMRLSAACVLVSCYSSLLLALAVLKARVSEAEAFELSRVEEAVQNERWGVDVEAEKKNARVKAETHAAGHFLRLLEAS